MQGVTLIDTNVSVTWVNYQLYIRNYVVDVNFISPEARFRDIIISYMINIKT